MNLYINESKIIELKKLEIFSQIIEKNIKTLRVFHRIGKTEDGTWRLHND